MKTDLKSREYAGTKVPDNVKIVPLERNNNYIDILKHTYERKSASTQSFPNGEMIIPKILEYRLIPGDLELRDEDDGYGDERIFDEFFEKIDTECFYWSSFGEIDIDIIFLAPYSSSNRLWMMNARFKDNVGITSVDGDFSILSDIFIRYCIVSGGKELIRELDKAWGGVDKIKADFVEYVEKMPRPENREWALKYLIPLLEGYELR